MVPGSSKSQLSRRRGALSFNVLISGLFVVLGAFLVVSCGDGGGGDACGSSSCPQGCCDGDTCLDPSPTNCGTQGSACVDCTADGRADTCQDGACICAAAGVRCDSGEYCSSSGCGSCQPDCQGKCAGADDGCGGSCTTTDCGSGCCDAGNLCVEQGAQDDDACGSGGEVCVSCVQDARADTCQAGGCICAAAGVRCDQGEFCTSNGCGTCQPQCQGRCAGADDGCSGTCPVNDCLSGCCDENNACVAYAAQDDTACGADGEACEHCVASGLTCSGSLHACMSARANDAQFVDQNVPYTMTTGQAASVSVTFRNIGTATWTDAAGRRMGSQNPQDNTTWSTSRVNLEPADSIAPGQTKTFTFQVTAPSSPGVYNFQWRMLEEGLAWFGEYSSYVPVTVGSPGVTVCEAIRSLAGTQTDATGGIQTCINNTPAGGILELPAGVYRLDGQIQISAAGITLRTEGKDPSMPKCAMTNHTCAELKASTSFGDTGGILQVLHAGSVLDHIVLNGNKTARASTPSGTQCGAGSNTYGHNMRMVCSNCVLMNSVTMNTLCGTGCEVAGTGSNVVVWRSTVAYNGVHNQQGMWADGVTVHDYANSTFAGNEFIDNTDVDLIFGGCVDCIIQENLIWHTTAFEGGSFAALMIHAWQSTSGNFNGANTSKNTIDCSTSFRCGFGLYLGSDAWYDTDVFGGVVHNNYVTNAQQGVLIDDCHDMAVYNNYVADHASSTNASCGNMSTTAYSMGVDSYNIDTSMDTMGTNYTSADWDQCIPNWWN